MQALAIASTHYTYPWRDGQAEWASVAGLNTKMVYKWIAIHLSTNQQWQEQTQQMVVHCTVWQ